MKVGICSVTFRNLPVERVVKLAAQANLECIEWGGDVHAPPAFRSRANPLETIRHLTEDAGLFVSSYGSYYSVTDGPVVPDDFLPVMDAAQTLGTSVVRIWANGLESQEADKEYVRRVADHVRHVAEMAKKRNLRLAFEFHQKTLTNTARGTLDLLETVNMPNVGTYWQPLRENDPFSHEEEIRILLPQLVHVHCHHIVGAVRRLLEVGLTEWRQLIGILAGADFGNALLIEFVRDNSSESLMRDAATLRRLVRSTRQSGRDTA